MKFHFKYKRTLVCKPHFLQLSIYFPFTTDGATMDGGSRAGGYLAFGTK